MAKHIATVMRYVTVGSAEWFHAVILLVSVAMHKHGCTTMCNNGSSQTLFTTVTCCLDHDWGMASSGDAVSAQSLLYSYVVMYHYSLHDHSTSTVIKALENSKYSYMFQQCTHTVLF